MKITIALAAIASIFMLLSINTNGEESMASSIHEFQVKTIDGEQISLSDYEGKYVLIVNVASKCGFTPQYEGLQKIYEDYKDKGFAVLGFPCNQFGKQEPGTNEEIKEFCTTKFNVSFPMFDKIDVNGKDAHPLYVFLKSEKSGLITDAIKWNFTKFLVSPDGKPLKRYGPRTTPADIAKDLEKYMEAN